jgi:serine protease Do
MTFKGGIMKIKNIVLTSLLVVAVLAMVFTGAEAKKGDTPKAEVAKKTFLGVYLQDLDEDTQEALDLKSDRGALVEGVVDGSPADKAGLKEQDVIVSLGGDKIDDSDQLRAAISDHQPGDEVDLVVLRNGREKSLKIELGSSDDLAEDIERTYQKAFEIEIPEPGDVQTYSFSIPSFNRPRMGVQIAELTEQLGDFFGVKGGKGALITEVVEQSPAQKAGLKAGDVIVRIGDEKIDGTSDVYRALEDRERGDKVNVEVVRNQGRESHTATVELEGPQKGKMHADTWNFKAPKMRGLQSPDVKVFTDKSFDRDELRQEMKKLRQEMEELKKELQELREE